MKSEPDFDHYFTTMKLLKHPIFVIAFLILKDWSDFLVGGGRTFY
jgi:hypothetical protein